MIENTNERPTNNGSIGGEFNPEISVAGHVTTNAVRTTSLSAVIQMILGNCGWLFEIFKEAVGSPGGLKIGPAEVPQQIAKIRHAYSEAKQLSEKNNEPQKEAIKDGKTAADDLKKMLPGFLFSGSFSKRRNSDILQHSGLVCLDIDDGAMSQPFEDTFVRLQKSPHLALLFKSPTGAGLKPVFRIPADPKRHGDSVWWLKKHVRELADADIDPQARDLARMCYLSHDPGLYVNLGAVEIPAPPPAPWDAWKDKTKTHGRTAPAEEGQNDGVGAGKESPCPEGDFDAITNWLRGRIIWILNERMLSREEKSESIAYIVVAAMNKVGRFFHQADKMDFATALFFNSFTKRLERIRSDTFLSWLSGWVAINRANASFKFIQTAVENAALIGLSTKPITPEGYWAARPNANYLSSGPGRMVKITATGPMEVDNGTDDVLFTSEKTLRPWKLLPHDQARDAFTTCSLFRDASYASGHGRQLLQLWIYSLPTNPRAKPPLVLAGTIGSGKTRLAIGIAELYGLPQVIMSPKDSDSGVRDFWAAVSQGGLLTLDNVDTRNRWLPDALAASSTGAGNPERKYYTNAALENIRPESWVAVTTANANFASDAGLADRLQVVRLNRRSGETSDRALSDEIMRERDAVLSHIVHTLSMAMADETMASSSINRRHPDFGAFAIKIGRALGQGDQALQALQAAEIDKSLFNLQNHWIGSCILTLLRREGKFSGPASALKTTLGNKYEPKLSDVSVKQFSAQLRKLVPHLEEICDVKTGWNGHLKVATFTFSNPHPIILQLDPTSEGAGQEADLCAGIAGLGGGFPQTSYRIPIGDF